MTVREISRTIDVGYRGVFDSVEKFLNAGVLHKSERPGSRKRVSLDRSFPAYAELRNLLESMGARFGVNVAPVNRAGCGSSPMTAGRRPPVDLQALFGSRNRAALMMLAVERHDVDREDVHELLSISICGAQGAIDFLADEGALRIGSRAGLRRPVSLDPSYFAHGELVALLRRILHLTPEYRTLARASRREVGGHRGPAISKQVRPRVRNPLKRAVRSLAFFETGAARVLLLLAATAGPVRTADLVKRAGVERGSVYHAILLLEKAGLVGYSVAPTEKGVDRWVFLRRDPTTRRVLALARAVARPNGLAPVDRGRAAKPPRLPAFTGAPKFEVLTRGARLRTLTAIARYPGIDVGGLSRELRIPRRQVKTNLDFLDRNFLVHSDERDERRPSRLHPNHDARNELESFLGAMSASHS